MQAKDWKNTFLAILLLITGKSSPRRNTLWYPYFYLGPKNFTHCNHFHRRLFPLQLRPTRRCSRLSHKTPLVWCSRMDWWLCPLSLGCRRRRCSRGLQKMLILLFTALLNWSNLIYLLSWVPYTGTWLGMVSLPS